MDKAKQRKIVISTGIGAIAGFVVAFGLMRAINSGVLGELDASRSAAALLGAIYLLCGLFVGFGLLNPRLGAKFLNVEDAEELREQSLMLRYSVFGILSLGLVLLLLALAAPLGPVPQEVVVAMVALLFLATWFTSKRLLEVADELNRSISRETASTAFYMLFAVGGGWAVLAHLAYVSGPAMLDWVTMFAGVTLVAAFWVSGRKGLLTPR